MAENEEENKSQSAWEGVLKKIQTFLPAIGVFAALIYFFGRLYLEEYYYALGISPDVLTFTTEGYMFSSFNTVVMCLIFSVLFFLCWRGVLFEKILSETSFAVIRQREPTTFFIIVLTWIPGVIYYLFFHFYPGLYVTGLSGLATGLVFGVGIIMIVIILRGVSKQISKGSFIFQWVIGVILAFSIMPWITTDLARTQADSDEGDFQDVRIITKEPLHCEMQSATSNLTDCLDGKLIITNSGITYVMKIIKTAKGTDCKTISISTIATKTYMTEREIVETTDDFTYCRLVYAIPVESINNIIYYTQK